MGNQYAPREFLLKLENVNLEEISDETLFFMMNQQKKIHAVVSTDLESGIVHAAPVSPLCEDVDYWIMFSKDLHFENGNEFPKDYYVRFRVKDGYCYATRDSLQPVNDAFFQDENILGPRMTMVIPFCEPGAPPPEHATTPVFTPESKRVIYVDDTQRKSKWWLFLILIPLFLLGLAVGGLFALRSLGVPLFASVKDDTLLRDFSVQSVTARARFTGVSKDDTIPELVTAAGGNGNGVLRASLMWNNAQTNQNDYDLICVEPDGTRIYFGNLKDAGSGALDVDVIYPELGKPAVENIAWGSTADLQEGSYSFFICNYTDRNGSGGFKGEIAFGNEAYAFSYSNNMVEKSIIRLGTCTYSRAEGFELIS